MQQDHDNKTQIKSVFIMVEELEKGYKQRLAALQDEYSADVTKMLRNCKLERQQFDMLWLQQVDEIAELKATAQTFEKLYNKEHIEHKITRDRLHEVLSELRTEQELLEIAQQRVNAATAELKYDIIEKVKKDIPGTNVRRTKQFFRRIIEKRLKKDSKSSTNQENSISY